MGWLHRPINIVLLFLLLSTTVFAETTYTYRVSDTGETNADITRDPAVLVALPLDVRPSESDHITYVSSYHTRKEQGVWHFDTTIPHADSVTLILPQAVHVIQSIPPATFTKSDVWQLQWTNLSGNITVSYVSTTPALAIETPALSLPTLPAIAALALTALALYAYSKRKQGQDKRRDPSEPDVSEAQLNILRAANHNEATILKTVLHHNGHIKRNMLERESDLSKSSLASSLKNLERKNIITIDRRFFVHYIGLTDWFKNL